MAFRRIDKDGLRPGHWALQGRYIDGKSTSILVLRQPVFVVDDDGRHHELKGGELYELSEEAVDNRSVEQIQDILDQNMSRFGINTVVCAVLDIAADRIADRNQIWVDKAAVGAQAWDMPHGFDPPFCKSIGAKRH